jgi:hypothetical protein
LDSIRSKSRIFPRSSPFSFSEIAPSAIPFEGKWEISSEISLDFEEINPKLRLLKLIAAELLRQAKKARRRKRFS